MRLQTHAAGQGARRSLVAVFALAVLLGACRDKAQSEDLLVPSRERPRLRTVLVADLTVESKRPMDLSLYIDGEIRRAMLSGDNFLAAQGTDQSACAAEFDVVYGWVINDKMVKAVEQGSARVAVDGRLHCLAPGADDVEPETYRVEMFEEVDFGRAGQDDGEKALKSVMSQLASRIARTLYGQALIRHATDEEILHALATIEHEGVLIEASSEAGERKLEGAVSALIGLTGHSVDQVRLRAGAALGLIGLDRPDVIQALVSLTRGSDPEPHLMAIHALGDIGGPEALRYLDAIAEGHPITAIRDAARGAASRSRSR
ncbi:MAG: HEAT repeat domain-containing protein [Myxococcota bacterium]|nr:HEAT repeat domain-containing protein [Myxococcota bacterium]MEE2780029.1 HEAT repeat domain-containing protein [Myxococcota bacterium]